MESFQSSGITVRWDPLPPGLHNGVLRGYQVYYQRRHHHDEEKNITTGPSETHVIINDVHQMREYEVSVAAFTLQEGPRSERREIVVG